MAPPFSIRRARPQDVDAVHQVHTEAIRAGTTGHYEPEAVEAWVEAFSPDNFPRNIERMEFFVAEDSAGQVGGFVAFDLETREVDSVYVAPWTGGSGLGTLLLRFAEESARQAGVQNLWLDSSINAVGFYAKYGWSEVERHARVRQGVSIPVVKMEKTLPS
jgi:N-acetylglutamate synthase-like GNAT family acetyltransferase